MSDDGLRVDRWLWCARFYKSRSLAAESVKAGHVRLNGQRIKPSREVRIGDSLSVLRGDVEYAIVIDAIPSRRGPAAEAARCYTETPESAAAREARREARSALDRPPTSGRPDKRTRRLIRSRVREPVNRD